MLICCSGESSTYCGSTGLHIASSTSADLGVSILVALVRSLIRCLAVPEPGPFSSFRRSSVTFSDGGVKCDLDLVLRSEMSFTRRGIMGKQVQRITLVTSASLSIC